MADILPTRFSDVFSLVKSLVLIQMSLIVRNNPTGNKQAFLPIMLGVEPGSYLLTWLNFNPSISRNVWDGITSKLWEWRSNSTPHFIMDVINYSFWGLKLSNVSERDPRSLSCDYILSLIAWYLNFIYWIWATCISVPTSCVSICMCASKVNLLTPWRWGCTFKLSIFKLISKIDALSSSCEMALR